MSADSHTPSRRHVLRALAAAPLFPLGGLAGCASTPANRPAAFRSVRFEGMAAPTLANPQAMATTTVQSAVTVTLADGSQRTQALAYQPFFMTGERLPDGQGGQVLAGGYYDIRNQPIVDRSVPGRERHFYSDCPDGSSLLTLPKAQVPGVKGNPVFAVVQF